LDRNKLFYSILFLLLASLVSVHGEPSIPVVPQGQFSSLLKQAPTINPQALQMALNALGRLKAAGQSVRSDVLMVIDYSKPSTEQRLWVFDLNRTGLLFQELVAHGRNSGDAAIGQQIGERERPRRQPRLGGGFHGQKEYSGGANVNL